MHLRPALPLLLVLPLLLQQQQLVRIDNTALPLLRPRQRAQTMPWTTRELVIFFPRELVFSKRVKGMRFGRRLGQNACPSLLSLFHLRAK